MTVLKTVRSVGLVAVVGAGLLTAKGTGQQPLAPAATRQLVQEASLPAIDRGLRDQDAPRAARSRDDADRLRAEAGDRLSYLRGSVIVKFKAEATTAGMTAATRQVAGDTVDRSGWANFDIIDIPDAADPEAAAALLRARPEVEYAQPRYRNYAMSKPNDPLYPNQWNFPAIDMERAWDIQPGGYHQHHRRRARQRRRVSFRHVPLQLTFPVPPGAGWFHLPRPRHRRCALRGRA